MLIGLGLVVVLVALAAAIATRPDTFRVERSATIAAPADVVFAQLNDFHRWREWSPWEKLDPNMSKTFTGAAAGVGSVYSWSGNKKAGEGSMAITESIPNERIALDLNFLRPFKSSNVTEFTLTPTAGGTQVKWEMSGDNTIPGKVISLVASMDKLVGKDFEAGLAKLKSLAEAEAGRTAGQPPMPNTGPTLR